MIKYINGDLLKSEEKVILHGCNCSNGFGSGFAKQVATKYPKAKYYYHSRFDARMAKPELGEIQEVMQWTGVTIINAFTQMNYGPVELGPYVSYPAIENAFTEALSKYDSIACPKVGAGLAGGNWEIIERIINRVSGDKEVRVYVL